MVQDMQDLENGTAPAPGRHCPAHYRYGPEVFRAAPPTHLAGLDVLYVVGGLYGNEAALERTLTLFERERGRKRLVFNGDFHWFDAEPALFERVQRTVLAFDALRGNVETELAGDEADATHGCGCAYPEWVNDGVVERSNRILACLRCATTAAQRRELAALPMWLRAEVGGLAIGIVHGDAESLAGWGFAAEHLAERVHRGRSARWFERAGVDAFACSHTCLPVFQRIGGGTRPRWVLNNGAAGMPNFEGVRSGLLTRIALMPFEGPERHHGLRQAGVSIDAIAIDYDTATFGAMMARLWPPGSDAHASYAQRIQLGPAYSPAQALRTED